MKHFNFLKPLLMALMLVGGVNCAWAQVSVPDPVYFKDFSSTTGLTQVGSGEFVTDADNRFGAIYHNNPSKNKVARTNYLKLHEDVLTHSGTTNEMTIGFWVHVKDAGSDYFHCPVFSAYASSTQGQNNGSPMFRCSAKGVMQLNNGDGHWTDFTKEENDDEGKKTSGNTESTVYLDDENWHYYTVTLTSTKGIIYVDGNVVNSWTIKSDDITPAFFSSAATGGYPVVCLGGNQSWDWNDWDASFGYDDFAVYDKALSPEQIAQIITNKIHYTINAVDGSSNVIKVFADADSRDNQVSVTYPRYILDGTTLRESAATDSKYTKSFELTSGKQISNIDYTKSSVSNVYYYAEGEDVLTNNRTDETHSLSLSMNKIGFTAGKTTFVKVTMLPAGTWTIKARYYCGNPSAAHEAYIKVGDEVKWSQAYENGKGGNAEKSSSEFTLTEPAVLSVAADGGSVTGFDWFYVSGTPSNTIVGKPDYSTDYLVEMSDKVTLAPGQSWHYKFVNHNMGSTAGMAQNWVLPIYASDGTTKKIVIRSDNWEDVKWANTGFGWTTSSGNWYDDFVTEMDNATVDMTVNYSSTNVLTMTATITTKTGRTLTYTYNSSVAEVSLSDNIKIAISVSHSWLELLESWPTSVSATIGEAGWATLYTPYALDFSEVAGLTAYTASLSDNIALTEVDDVPANTGVVLKGTADTYNIPVITSSETNKGSLIGNATEATACDAASSGYAYYVLAQAEDYPTHKIQFRPVTTGSIAAGKAFLEAPYAAGVKALNVVFSEATGINSVQGSAFKVQDSAIFNLAGQRMSKMQKGINIVNGKKVIVK